MSQTAGLSITQTRTSGKWPHLEEGAWAFASVSDLHLGARRNDTRVMIKALDDGIVHSGLLDYVDMLILAGDVFDGLLSLDDPRIIDIDKWIARLFRHVKEASDRRKKKIIFRVLEGTRSHDYYQSIRFETIKDILDIDVDFRYIPKTEIEYIPSLKAHVLFIPDGAHATTTETQRVVEALLESRGLTQVDIGVMHGYFKYQLPYATREGSYHDIDYYTKIVRKWITIGHVHTRSRNGIVLAQGSYDRHSQGEEEAKGLVMATVGNQKDEAWFIDNVNAHIHKTIDIYDMGVDEGLAHLEQELSKLPPRARVRIRGEVNNPIFEYTVKLQISWPELVITKEPESKGEKTIAEKVLDDVVSKWVPVRIDNVNVSELIETRLREKRKLDPERTSKLVNLLKGCL